jgi:hypothetical protein
MIIPKHTAVLLIEGYEMRTLKYYPKQGAITRCKTCGNQSQFFDAGALFYIFKDFNAAVDDEILLYNNLESDPVILYRGDPTRLQIY